MSDDPDGSVRKLSLNLLLAYDKNYPSEREVSGIVRAKYGLIARNDPRREDFEDRTSRLKDKHLMSP